MAKKELTNVPRSERPAVNNPNVRLFTKTPSKRTQAWAKGLLERRAEFPPWMVAELEKFAAGRPYVTEIEIINVAPSQNKPKTDGK